MLKYLDTCTSDYFQGFSGHVYAVPLSHGMTYKQVFAELKTMIQQEEIYGFEGNYAAIENECEGLRFAAKESGYIDSVFSPFIEESDSEYSETVFAYFGFRESV